MTVLFDADITNSGYSKYASKSPNPGTFPGRLTVVRDPLGHPRNVIQMTCFQEDVSPRTPTENPRVQLEGPNVIELGMTVHIFMERLFPNNWPDMTSGASWLTLGSVYGPPYAGSSPNPMSHVPDGNAVRFKPWSGIPIAQLRGKWWQVHLEQHQARDMTGYIKIRHNLGSGWQTVQSGAADGSDRFYHATAAPGVNDGGPNHHSVNIYHLHNTLPDRLTGYLSAHKIATTAAEVLPNSYPAGVTTTPTPPPTPPTTTVLSPTQRANLVSARDALSRILSR